MCTVRGRSACVLSFSEEGVTNTPVSGEVSVLPSRGHPYEAVLACSAERSQYHSESVMNDFGEKCVAELAATHRAFQCCGASPKQQGVFHWSVGRQFLQWHWLSCFCWGSQTWGFFGWSLSTAVFVSSANLPRAQPETTASCAFPSRGEPRGWPPEKLANLFGSYVSAHSRTQQRHFCKNLLRPTTW